MNEHLDSLLPLPFAVLDRSTALAETSELVRCTREQMDGAARRMEHERIEPVLQKQWAERSEQRSLKGQSAKGGSHKAHRRQSPPLAQTLGDGLRQYYQYLT